MFPLGRGLFEDKVANFWCATNVVYKWRDSPFSNRLPLISLAMTLLGLLPSVLHVLYVSWSSAPSEVAEPPLTSIPEKESTKIPFPATPLRSKLPTPASSLLPLSLFNCSMAFFLFSFQVHEKSILLPLIPMTLMMSAREDLGSSDVGVWEWGVLLNNTAMFR